MLRDRIFQTALIISLTCHLFLFMPTSGAGLNMRENQLEVIYFSKANEFISAAGLKSVDKKGEVDTYTKPAEDKRVFETASLPQKTPRATEVKKKTSTTHNAEKKEIKPKIKTTESELNKSKEYHDYYQLLRAKIKNYVSYPTYPAEGEVNLSFTINSSGQLKFIKIHESTSTGNTQLRLAALESIKRANPFPPFPEKLTHQEATFNIIISFEAK